MRKISPLIAVYDRAAESFNMPALVENEGIAIRGFLDAINRPQSESDLANHPEDFDLYVLGEFNSETGLLTPIHPESVLITKPLLQGKQAKIQGSPGPKGKKA